jgi:hypothetical protein
VSKRALRTDLDDPVADRWAFVDNPSRYTIAAPGLDQCTYRHTLRRLNTVESAAAKGC